MSETDIVAIVEEAAKRSARQFRLDTVDAKELYRTILHVAVEVRKASRSDLSRMREALDDARKWVIIARTYAVHREEATKALAKIDAALSPAEKGEA